MNERQISALSGSNNAQAGDTDAAMDSKSDYDITSMQYPKDLGSDNSMYGGNRVVFFINVQGGGKIATEDAGGTATMPMPEERYEKKSGTNVKDTGELFGAIAEKSGMGKNLIIGKPKRRLKSAISLYIPESVVKSYSVDWGEVSSDELLGGELAAQAALTTWNSMPGTSIGESDSNSLISSGIAVGATRLLNGMKYSQKATGITPGNSKAQLLFNKVDFGGFSFDYRFAPRDSAEAETVLKIIRTFRHHMLPEFFDKQQYLYIYPSEFEVRYFRGATENTYLEHHMTAVLTNMTINYAPNGQYSTFQDGMPTHINMTLAFKELGVPTKETSPDNRSGA